MDALVTTQAPEGVNVHLACAEVAVMLLAHIICHIGRVDNEGLLLARGARLGRCAASPTESGENGEVLTKTLSSDGLRVAGLDLKWE